MSRGHGRVHNARAPAPACLCASRGEAPRSPLHPGRRRRHRNGSCAGHTLHFPNVAIVLARVLQRKLEALTRSERCGSSRMELGRDKVAILADIATVKALSALLVLAAFGGSALCGFAAAQVVPLPRPRPPQISTAEPAPEGVTEEAAPSACRLRLTAELADAPSLPPLIRPGECNVDDVVRLEAGWLLDKTPVAGTPPAVPRWRFVEAVVHRGREDLTPAVRLVGGGLRRKDNFAAFVLRRRHRIIGAALSGQR